MDGSLFQSKSLSQAFQALKEKEEKVLSANIALRHQLTKKN
jgi:hypothetical protein